MWRLLGLGELSGTSSALVCEASGGFILFFSIGVGNTTGIKDTGDTYWATNMGYSIWDLLVTAGWMAKAQELIGWWCLWEGNI